MSKDVGKLINRKSIIFVVGLFLAISRIWLLRELYSFPRDCYILWPK